jgi:hypothetical protein
VFTQVVGDQEILEGAILAKALVDVDVELVKVPAYRRLVEEEDVCRKQAHETIRIRIQIRKQ